MLNIRVKSQKESSTVAGFQGAQAGRQAGNLCGVSFQVGGAKRLGVVTPDGSVIAPALAT